MTDRLYKVAPPRDGWTFEPRPFWRTEDWSSSSDNQKGDGYVRDEVLYAGGFDEVFDRMWRFYLQCSEAGFRSGYLDVQQLVFRREVTA